MSIEHLIFKNDIQTIRKNCNPTISQSKLAKILGIRRDKLSMIETGYRLPTPEILTQIKIELNCLYRDLYSQEILNLINDNR